MTRLGILLVLTATLFLTVGCSTESGTEIESIAAPEKAPIDPPDIEVNSLEDLVGPFHDAMELIEWEEITFVFDPAQAPAGGYLVQSVTPGDTPVVAHVLNPTSVTSKVVLTVWVPANRMTLADQASVGMPVPAFLYKTHCDGTLGDVRFYLPAEKYYELPGFGDDLQSFTMEKVDNTIVPSEVADAAPDALWLKTLLSIDIEDSDETKSRGIFDPPGDVVPPGDE